MPPSAPPRLEWPPATAEPHCRRRKFTRFFNLFRFAVATRCRHVGLQRISWLEREFCFEFSRQRLHRPVVREAAHVDPPRSERPRVLDDSRKERCRDALAAVPRLDREGCFRRPSGHRPKLGGGSQEAALEEAEQGAVVAESGRGIAHDESIGSLHRKAALTALRVEAQEVLAKRPDIPVRQPADACRPCGRGLSRSGLQAKSPAASVPAQIPPKTGVNPTMARPSMNPRS